jgi:PTS system nitrogen regulatory IIA component
MANMANEIMTLEEVAKYLRVSERTVYDWAQKGEIPAGKLGTAWRFRKKDIERWVDGKLSGKKLLSDSHQIRIKSLLNPERVCFLKSAAKREALLELAYLLAEAPQVEDRDRLVEAIFKREELMSTGIGQGIAIPHVRIPSVRDLCIAAGISKEGIGDYQALDDQPVHFVLMLAAGEDQHAYYLKALSSLSARLKDPKVKKRVISAETAEQAYSLLTAEE